MPSRYSAFLRVHCREGGPEHPPSVHKRFKPSYSCAKGHPGALAVFGLDAGHRLGERGPPTRRCRPELQALSNSLQLTSW